MPAAEVVGRSNRDLRIPGNDKALQALENSIRFVFQTGLNATYYTQRTFPEGIRYYYMKLTPGFIDGTTQVESVWAITPEINTLKQYEKKLRQSRKALRKKNQQLDQVNANLDTFFHTVSHDWRNPLANIKAAVNLLKKVKHEQVEPFVGLLEQSTGRLDEILSAVCTEFREQLTGVDGEISADFSACPAVSGVKPYLDSRFAI